MCPSSTIEQYIGSQIVCDLGCELSNMGTHFINRTTLDRALETTLLADSNQLWQKAKQQKMFDVSFEHHQAMYRPGL